MVVMVLGLVVTSTNAYSLTERQIKKKFGGYTYGSVLDLFQGDVIRVSLKKMKPQLRMIN